jgi:hypothetical protein
MKFISTILFLFLASPGLAVNVVYGAGKPILRGPTAADMTFTVGSTATYVITSAGSTSTGTNKDCNVTTHTGATTRTDYQLGITAQVPALFDVTYSSLSPAIATVDASGYVTRVSNGTAGILSRANIWPFLTKRTDCAVISTVGQTITTYDSFVTGSMGKDAADAVDTLISSVTSENASTYRPMYSSRNDTAGTYTRNASCWASTIDLTPISVWNSTGANTRAGVLVSPRHIICAEHFPPADGATIRFIKADNTVITKTISSHLTIAGTDIRVCYLDSDVGAGIAYAKVLPSTWATTYLPGVAHRSVPILATDQEKNALVVDTYNNFSATAGVGFVVPSDSHRLALNESIITGDSGSPVFMVVSGGLVLLTTWHYGGAGSGPNIQYYISDIDTAMSTLGGGYSLTQVTLTGFNAY